MQISCNHVKRNRCWGPSRWARIFAEVSGRNLIPPNPQIPVMFGKWLRWFTMTLHLFSGGGWGPITKCWLVCMITMTLHLFSGGGWAPTTKCWLVCMSYPRGQTSPMIGPKMDDCFSLSSLSGREAFDRMPEELAEVLAGQANVASWKIHHIADETATIFDDLLEELAGSNDFIRGASSWWVFCYDFAQLFSIALIQFWPTSPVPYSPPVRPC